MKSCGQWEEVYNSPEDTLDYWGELIRFLRAIWERVYRFQWKEDRIYLGVL